MAWNNHVAWPRLGVLREALVYEPSDPLRPLLCQKRFEEYRAGERPGYVSKGSVFVKMGGGSTYLRNLVWRVAEGSVPSGFKVECCGSLDDNRIENLRLVHRDGSVRLPKAVPLESLVPGSPPEKREDVRKVKPKAKAAGGSSVPQQTPQRAQAGPFHSGEDLPWEEGEVSQPTVSTPPTPAAQAMCSTVDLPWDD